MNIKCLHKKVKSQEKKADLYIQMGIMIVVVAIMWSIKGLIPNIVFIIVAVIGLIPAINMAMTEFSEPTDEERTFWNKAELSTGRLILELILFYWTFECADQLFDLPISADPTYMIPGWIGIAFLFTGHYFKVYKMFSEEDDE